MNYSLLWLPDVLRAAGLTVDVTSAKGWETRGHGDFGRPLGIICHHTCGPRDGNLRDLGVLVNGRPDLAGPLCNLGLGRDGVYVVVAAGKAWHAGAGNWLGIKDGNTNMIGIEAENIGTSDAHGNPLEPWSPVQVDAYKRGCAAILRHIGRDSSMCAGHKEYALPHGRKDDPNFDMVAFRADVQKFIIAQNMASQSKPLVAPVAAAPTTPVLPKDA